MWHLCRHVDDPGTPEHLTAAAACLDRGDIPELVEVLRQFTLCEPSPELRARFSGPPLDLSDSAG